MKGRKIISILLLFFLTLNICSYVFIRAYYEGYKDYITAHFCINKDKPELHCNGQCHINKIINKIDYSQHDSLILFDNLLHIYIFTENFTINIKAHNIHNNIVHNSIYIGFITKMSNSILIPPPQV